MGRINPLDSLRDFDRVQRWQIDSHGVAVTPHQHTLQRFIVTRIDFLVGHIGRDKDEVAGACLGGKLQLVAPAHARPALQDIDDAFEMAVMVCTRLGAGVDVDGSSPELLCTYPGKVDGGGAVHAWCRVGAAYGFERVGGDHSNASCLPGVFWRGW